jgi:hypothetical protein
MIGDGTAPRSARCRRPPRGRFRGRSSEPRFRLRRSPCSRSCCGRAGASSRPGSWRRGYRQVQRGCPAAERSDPARPTDGMQVEIDPDAEIDDHRRQQRGDISRRDRVSKRQPAVHGNQSRFDREAKERQQNTAQAIAPPSPPEAVRMPANSTVPAAFTRSMNAIAAAIVPPSLIASMT